ncbi:MAG: hypothetical protein ACETWG_01375 [Candidatus Neomarinimicrobiota bacterium]
MKVQGIEHQGVSAQLKGAAPQATHPADPKGDKRLWKACQNFEALFMGYLVKSMERTLPQGTLSGSGLSSLMFHQVMGSALSEGGGIGLAELLYRDLQSKHPQDPSENDKGISLQDLLTYRVRKENDD